MIRYSLLNGKLNTYIRIQINTCFMKKYTPFLLLLMLFSTAFLYAQEQPLPNYLTNEEKLALPNYSFGTENRTPPPTGPVRTMAEWEEVEYLVITW